MPDPNNGKIFCLRERKKERQEERKKERKKEVQKERKRQKDRQRLIERHKWRGEQSVKFNCYYFMMYPSLK